MKKNTYIKMTAPFRENNRAARKLELINKICTYLVFIKYPVYVLYLCFTAGKDIIDGAGNAGKDVIDGAGDAGKDVISGVHFISDVVGAFVFAAIEAYIVTVFFL